MNPNAGAEGNGYREQDITFEIGRILASILQANGFETIGRRSFTISRMGNVTCRYSAACCIGDFSSSTGIIYFNQLFCAAIAGCK